MHALYMYWYLGIYIVVIFYTCACYIYIQLTFVPARWWLFLLRMVRNTEVRSLRERKKEHRGQRSSSSKFLRVLARVLQRNLKREFIHISACILNPYEFFFSEGVGKNELLGHAQTDRYGILLGEKMLACLDPHTISYPLGQISGPIQTNHLV